MTLGELYLEADNFSDYMTRIFGSKEDAEQGESVRPKGKPNSATLGDGQTVPFMAEHGLVAPSIRIDKLDNASDEDKAAAALLMGEMGGE